MTRPFAAVACVCLTGAVASLPLAAWAAKKSPLEAARDAMAEASFEKALTLAEAGLKATNANSERAQLQLVRAECLSALRRLPQLKEALEKALLADPVAAFDAATTNPELVAALDAARHRLAGKVSVGPPPTAPAPDVLLDGESLGRAPVEVSTFVGRHALSFVYGQWNRRDVEVVVSADTVTSVTVLPPAVPVASPEVAKSDTNTEAKAEAPARFRWPVVPLVAGGALAIGGVVLLGAAGGQYGQLTGGDGVSTLALSRTEAQALADQGQAMQNVGIALLVTGAAAAAFGGVALAVGLDKPAVALVPSAGGAALVVSGPLP